MLAGAATETVASSSAGVAEDLVRVFEGLAHSLQGAISPIDRKHVLTDSDIFDDESLPQKMQDDPSGYITYGLKSLSPLSPVATDEAGDCGTLLYFANIKNAITIFITYIMADTEGVPSAAPQLLGVIVILYLLTFMILGSGESNLVKNNRQGKKEGVSITPAKDKNGSLNITTSMSPVSESPAIVNSASTTADTGDKKRKFWAVIVIKCCFNAVISKRSLLVVIYSLAWVYLCHISKTRSDSIMR